jgi:hypothetical protein
MSEFFQPKGGPVGTIKLMKLWKTLRKIPLSTIISLLVFLGVTSIGAVLAFLGKLPLGMVVTYIANVLQQATPLWLFILWVVITAALLLFFRKKRRARKGGLPFVHKNILGVDWEIYYKPGNLGSKMRPLCPERKCGNQLKILPGPPLSMRCERCGFIRADFKSNRDHIFVRVRQEIERRNRLQI